MLNHENWHSQNIKRQSHSTRRLYIRGMYQKQVQTSDLVSVLISHNNDKLEVVEVTPTFNRQGQAKVKCQAKVKYEGQAKVKCQAKDKCEGQAKVKCRAKVKCEGQGSQTSRSKYPKRRDTILEFFE